MNNETITILIVDDQPSNLKFLARLLQNQGYRVRRAISGELALNAAFASPPDLILLDILMPEINGYEVCERLKKDRRTENIPIIFISVIDRADEKVRAFKAGGVDYITKPFQANEVLARIDHQLTIRRLQQQLEAQNAQLKEEIYQRSIAQEKFAKAFSSSPHAIALKTFPEGQYLDANESFFELLGYSPSEIIGFCAQDLDIWVHSQQRERFHRQLTEQKGVIRNLEVEFRTKSGQIKTLLLSAELIDLQGQNCVTLVTNDISDRKQLEEEIAQQKRFLNAIIDYIPMGVFVKDVKDEMRYVIWNQFSERTLGVLRADLLGRNNWQVFPEHLAHSWQEEDQELMRIERAIVYPEQEIDDYHRQIKMWVQTTKAPIIDESGKISHILGIFNDISDRRRAEIALRESEKKYRDLVETSQDIIWSMDLDGCFTFVNPAMTRICGYELEEVICRPFWDLIPPQERRDNAPKFLRVLQGKPLMQHEQKYLAKDDRWIYLQVNAIAVYDELGQAIGVTGTATDITERKRVEEALRESVEREVAIATIIERMRRTLEIETIFNTTTQELRRVLNCDRVIIYRFNPDWSGEVVAEAVGEEWISLLEQDRDRFAITTASDDCVIKQLHETITIEDTHLKKTQGGGYRRGTRYLCIEDIYTEKFSPCYLKLLEKFQARAYLTVPIFTSVQENENENEELENAPKLWGLLASYQNSAPRHWQEEEINMAIQIGTQMGIALQQAELLEKTQQQSEALKIAKETADAGNRAKSEFLASMSHELRTPLNAILGFTQLMVRDDRLDREHQENLNIINRSGEHLLALINDVLEMSKIEAGRATFNEDDFNLYRLLDSVEDMLRMKANGKGLQLICDRDRDLPQFVSTDAQKLRQVLINLLSNAIKFTDTGFVTLRVNKRRGNQKLYFEVEDTGCGIASEDVEKIFEAFGQTKDGAKASEGTGLGLPISQQFVRLMGGELDLESERGRGSKFFFEIPINMSSEPILESSISSKKNLRAIVSPDFPDVPYRFLIVEDREYNRLLLLNLLTSLGLEVETANNGVEAIALWESWQPHFIWMDIRMPVMDGYEATRQIRLREEEIGERESGVGKREKVPIVALTASAFLEDRAKALAVGCDDFLSKPFQEDELLGKIEKYLLVQYLYENETDSKNEDRCDSEPLLGDLQGIGDNELSSLSSALQTMPENWRKRLYDASIQCSDRLIFEAIAEIPKEHSHLAIALANFVEEFRFDLVMELAIQSTEQ
ncbi:MULTISPECIES: PAS domain S-box protein [Spirulina sp. CCY15215]|uniref:PAS domain S-box protein n=1 Tax=Spirulina sp. CCY15215 TaxID=2767591 RepID=UPI00194EE3D0|nr:PAS domain S-box protein [Spirulina major]